MFLPKSLKQDNPTEIFELIRRYPFATVVLMTAEGLEVDHLPLFVEKNTDNSHVLLGHLAKANTLCNQLIQGDVKVIFHGPAAYISPQWYPSKKEHGRAVPTWNYSVVHIEGDFTFQHDEEWKYQLLEKQSNFHEQQFQTPWKLSDAPEEYIHGLLKGIVGLRINIKSITAKWKVSKDKTDTDKQGVREGLSEFYAMDIIEQLVAENIVKPPQ